MHKQKRLRSFTFRSRWCYCFKINAAPGVAFLSVLSSSHLLAAAAPAHARLSQVRRRVAAPAAVAPAAAAAAVAADHKHPALSLFDRVLDLQVRHREAA